MISMARSMMFASILLHLIPRTAVSTDNEWSRCGSMGNGSWISIRTDYKVRRFSASKQQPEYLDPSSSDNHHTPDRHQSSTATISPSHCQSLAVHRPSASHPSPGPSRSDYASSSSTS